MIDDKYMPVVLDYLDGKLNKAQEQELKALLEAGVLQEQELLEMRSMIMMMEHEAEIAPHQPSEQLRTNFFTMLAAEAAAEKKPGLLQSIKLRLERFFFTGHIRAGSVLAGTLLLVLGIGLGYWLRPVQPYEQQISLLQHQLQQAQQVALLSQLEQASATERLKAVNLSQALPQANQQVIDALLYTLNNDPSINVRMAAIEALHVHARHPRVREGLVRSFEQQDSPLVLIALAEEVAALQEKRAVAPMQKLLEQKELDSTVKQQINQSIQVLL